MAWRFVEQPNGKLARFSEVVDDFTDYDLTETEAYSVARDHGCDPVVSDIKIDSARKNPNRFFECIAVIRRVHGKEVSQARLKQIGRT